MRVSVATVRRLLRAAGVPAVCGLGTGARAAPHADHEPHHVLGRQLGTAHRRGVGRGQRVGDPLRVDRRAELVETRRRSPAASDTMASPTPIVATSVGETNYYLWIKRSRTRSLARNDRHCR